MKNSSDTIRNQTHDLPAGSARTRQKDDLKSKATPFSKTKRITTCLCEQKKKKKKKKKDGANVALTPITVHLGVQN